MDGVNITKKQKGKSNMFSNGNLYNHLIFDAEDVVLLFEEYKEGVITNLRLSPENRLIYDLVKTDKE